MDKETTQQPGCTVSASDVTLNAQIREGQALRAMRVSLDMSQKAMAAQIGVSAALISRFERGRNVARRKFLVSSYTTALRLCSYQQREQCEHIFDNIKNFL